MKFIIIIYTTNKLTIVEIEDLRGVRLRKFNLRKIILRVRMHFHHNHTYYHCWAGCCECATATALQGHGVEVQGRAPSKVCRRCSMKTALGQKFAQPEIMWMGLMYLLTYLIFDGHESKQQFLSLNTDSVLFSSRL